MVDEQIGVGATPEEEAVCAAFKVSMRDAIGGELKAKFGLAAEQLKQRREEMQAFHTRMT